MKVALVHDWLVTYAGAEKVLEQMLLCYPDADVFSLIDFLPEDERAFLQGKCVKTSFLQKLPWAKSKYRAYLPLMPLAIEQFDLSQYDLVISSSHAVAKGVLTGPDQLHISYVHSPIRYAWDMQHEYLKQSGLATGVRGFFVKWMLHKIRIWDCRTAYGVDHFIANSKFIARRIEKVYRRESEVIYPPVDVSAFSYVEDKEEFYLTASRLVPYKRVDLVVDAFAQMPEKRLIVIGDGPEMKKIQKKATDNISVLGYQSFEVLKEHMQRAKAFVFAAEEDFGIMPVEAQACGTPVIALQKGGACETVVNERTGLFFQQQTVSALCDAVEKFESQDWSGNTALCREQALQFSAERFRDEFVRFVSERWQGLEQRGE
ncbi:MAG: glycosyltransferase family 4 protein [Gammaproteobacteria bacterium]|nr:glycosyltransferase family 4 protein [Gammaproteobacteria bacterium]